MSVNLGGTYSNTDNAAVAQYDAEVKQSYQGSAYLKERVKVKSGVVGQTHFFRRIGKGQATQHTSSELITPVDYSHTKIAATLTNWRIGDYTDLFDDAETNIDERMEIAQADADALGRREDQLIIDAMDDASGIAGTVDEDFGGTDSSLTADKLRRAINFLRSKQARGMDPTVVVNADALEGALAETQITSSDFQVFKALTQGDMNGQKAFGFHWVVMEDRDEGGLPENSTNIRTNFAFDRRAVGLAHAIEPRSYVDWVPERLSWLSQAVVKAGAAAIDPEGIVAIESFES